MPLKALYQDIAKHYATADQFGAISQSHSTALMQIKEQKIFTNADYKVLDFGVGNGFFLENLRHILPQAHFTGIDISMDKLTEAKKILPLTAIEASAAKASHYLPHHSQDMVLAHFINAYISIPVLFSEANALTRANGYFSLITTTYESFPLAQQYLAKFIAEGSLLSSIVGHYYKTVVNNTTVASGLDELLRSFAKYNFNIIAHQRLELPIRIDTLDELIAFSYEGTWFLNTTSIRILPKKFLLQRLSRLFSKIFTFPYHDTHVIDIILAKK